MNLRLVGSALFASVLLSGPVLGHDFRVGEIKIEHPWTRASPATAPTAAGYMKFINDGEADRLVSAKSPKAARVEIHETTMSDGVMRMRQLVNGLEIPAKSAAALVPGGAHLMLIGPVGGYVQGERVPVTLSFERAGEFTVELAVEGPGARSSHH